MKLRPIFCALALASLLPTAEGFGRGGETGTLDEVNAPKRSIVELDGKPAQALTPHYLPRDAYRRLRSRLRVHAKAPVPGWGDRRAWRFQDRLISEDNVHEIFPEDGSPTAR